MATISTTITATGEWPSIAKAEPGANQTLAEFAPERFHIPAYLGPRGWVGLWIDLPSINWDEVESIIEDAYRLTAPKRLVAQLDSDRLRSGEAARLIEGTEDCMIETSKCLSSLETSSRTSREYCWRREVCEE